MPTEPALFKQFLPVIKVTGGGSVKKELSIWCFFEITDLELWHPTTYEILRLMVWFPCMEIIH